MEGLITADDANKRWKYLRDCYVRYKRESMLPRKPKEFRFAEMMSFVDATDLLAVNESSEQGYLSDASEELSLNIPRLTSSTPNKTDSSKNTTELKHFANCLIEGMAKLPQKNCRKLQTQMIELLAKTEKEVEEEEKEDNTKY